MTGKTSIYGCKACGKDFSFVGKAKEKPKCPKCGETKKLVMIGQQG